MEIEKLDPCETLLQRMCTDLSEDIHSPLCQELLEHIEQCPDCRNNLLSLQKTVDLFKCLGNTNVPGKVHERLMTLLNLK